MEMPLVLSCDMTDCDYNRNEQCHAMAVTIGDSDNPMCDTFWVTEGKKAKAGDPKQSGRIGACRMSQCIYNERLQCMSGSITVGQKEQNPMCRTYNPHQ
jgi:hypothetical protein